MSQLANFSRQVEALKVAADTTLKESADDYGDREFVTFVNKLQTLVTQCEKDLQPVGEKLQIKLHQVDPVTGNKRYGKQAEQKFLSSMSDLSNVFSLLSSALERAHPRYLESSNRLADVEREENAQQAANAPPPPVYSKIIVERFGENVYKQLSPEATEEMQLLHQKAEALRIKKNRESEELRDLFHRTHRFLENFAEHLNKSSLYGDVKACIETTKTLSKQPTDWKPMQQLLVDVLRRIISKPDDVNLRRLRATHPVIHSKVTSKVGSILLLLSLGFRCVVKASQRVHDSNFSAGVTEEFDDSATLHWIRGQQELCISLLSTAESFPRESVTTVSLAQESYELFGKVFPLLLQPASSGTGSGGQGWEMLFEMQEPAVDDLMALTSTTQESNGDPSTSVGLSWIDWYDRLQSSVSSLESS